MEAKNTSNPEEDHPHITEDGKGSLAEHIGASVAKGLQIAAFDIKDKSVSYIKTNMPKNVPTDLKTLPSHFKSNVKHIGVSSFKYVRKKITLKQLAIFAFELMTAKVYTKIGMTVVYGLFNLAWNAYVKPQNKSEMKARTLDQSRNTTSEVNRMHWGM
uniref:Uncharacterized protein n=1 Tax=Cacopsylla melanoneura TaxID=428564 RepID=A0A8D9BDT6_9HEMI